MFDGELKMKKTILAAMTGLLLASTAAMAAPPAPSQTEAQQAYMRQTGEFAPNFTQVNPTGGN